MPGVVLPNLNTVAGQNAYPTPFNQFYRAKNEWKSATVVPQYTVEEVVDSRNTEYVKLVGLPYQATIESIAEFLSGATLYSDGEPQKDITLLKGKNGSPNGKALVRLCNTSEAKRVAKAFHLKVLQWRYVEVYHLGAKEVGWHNLPLMQNEETAAPKEELPASLERPEFCYVHNPYSFYAYEAVEEVKQNSQ